MFSVENPTNRKPQLNETFFFIDYSINYENFYKNLELSRNLNKKKDFN